MSSDQYRIDVKKRDINGTEIMVLIMRSVKAITGIFRLKGNTRLRVEVSVIEGRRAYWRKLSEGGTDLIQPDWHQRY